MTGCGLTQASWPSDAAIRTLYVLPASPHVASPYTLSVAPADSPSQLLIGSAPDLPLGTDRFNLRAALYSLTQRAVVATAEQGCVSYDYRRLSKCELPKDFREALEGRGRKN